MKTQKVRKTVMAGLMAAATLVVATSPSQAADCALDVGGLYKSEYGQRFEINQDGCTSVSLVDLENNITYDFPLDGKTVKSLPQAFFDIQKYEKGNNVLRSVQYVSQIVTPSKSHPWLTDIKVKLVGAVDLPSLSKKKAIPLEFTADATITKDYHYGLIRIAVRNIRLRSNDESGLMKVFLKGANTILAALDSVMPVNRTVLERLK
jgi:hypothetical protein